MDRYVVVGNPIAHSRSPEIHKAFARQFGAVISYEKVLIAPGEFAAFADEFAASGGAGMNVTVPFKRDAFAYVQQTDAFAAAAGAVNTLVFSPDQPCVGYNTDGIGLCTDLQQRHGVTLEGSNVLLLGAGGAASGVIQPLLAALPNKLIVANRTVATAESLVRHHLQWLQRSAPLSACGFEELQGSFDVVINATSTGLSGATAPIAPQLVSDAFCYDMSYGESAVFARWAERHGAAMSVDGLGMLVEQAAESFRLWRGVRPQTDPVVALMRSSQ
jgi:shikimate dehydrogenase